MAWEPVCFFSFPFHALTMALLTRADFISVDRWRVLDFCSLSLHFLRAFGCPNVPAPLVALFLHSGRGFIFFLFESLTMKQCISIFNIPPSGEGSCIWVNVTRRAQCRLVFFHVGRVGGGLGGVDAPRQYLVFNVQKLCLRVFSIQTGCNSKWSVTQHVFCIPVFWKL